MAFDLLAKVLVVQPQQAVIVVVVVVVELVESLVVLEWFLIHMLYKI